MAEVAAEGPGIDLNLDSLVQVQHVQVVQSIDPLALQQTLRWVVDQLKTKPASDLDGRLGALEKQNADLLERLKGLEDAQSKQNAEANGAPAVPADLTALNDKVDALAAQLEQLQGAQPAGTAAADGTPRPVTPTGTAAGPPSIERLMKRVEGCERSIEALTATDLRLQQQKADVADLEALRAKLAAKADKAELDAVLNGAAGIGKGPEDHMANLVDILPDGTVDQHAVADAVNKTGQDVHAIKALIALLQERLGQKADSSLVEDLSGQVSGQRDSLGKLEQATLPVLPRHDQRISGLEAEVSQLSGTGPVLGAAAAAGSPEVASAAGSPPVSVARSLSVIPPLDLAKSTPEDYHRAVADLQARMEGLEADLLARLGALQQALEASAHPAAAAVADAVAAVPAARMSMVATLAGGGADVEGLKAELAELALRLADLGGQLDGKADKDALDGKADREELEALTSQVAAAADAAAAAAPAALAAQSGAAMDALEAMAAAAAGPPQLDADGNPIPVSMDLGPVLTALRAMERLLVGKADADKLAALERALGGKASADKVTDLEMNMASKADRAAVDELRLRLAMLQAGDAGDSGSLLDTLQSLLADKASKQEVELCQDRLSGKANKEELDPLRATLDGELQAMKEALEGKGSRDLLDSLKAQMGDIFSELEALRNNVNRSSSRAAGPGLLEMLQAAPGGGGGGMDAADKAVLAALAGEMQGLVDRIDTLAHATNILAAGLDLTGPDNPNDLSPRGPGQPISHPAYGGKESRNPKGAYERLVKMLGRGEYHHKMDWFDPDILSKMAQKVASVDALMKNPSMLAAMRGGGMGVAGYTDMGIRDLENQLKRVIKDLRNIKQQLVDWGITAARPPEGEHAMLTGKPIMGYRCMACDRPLIKLDERPGPYVPTYQLPVSVQPAGAPEIRTHRQPSPPSLSPQNSETKFKKNYQYDPDKRGPQNWYEDQKGLPAEALPKEDVGPKLPGGGWKANVVPPGTSSPGTLPQISSRQGRSPVAGGRQASQAGDGSGNLPSIS